MWQLSLTIFLLIIMPREFNIDLGIFGLSPYRFWLLILTPFLIKSLFTNRKFKWQSFDYFALSLCIWPSFALLINTGLQTAIESGGIVFLELFTPYFLTRQVITSYSSLRLITKQLLYLIAVIALIGVPEAITGTHYAHDFLRAMTGNSVVTLDDTRLGLTRASSLTDHPILLGSISATGVVLAFSLIKQHFKYALLATTSVLGVIASVSSAPLLGLLSQVVLLIWSKIFSGKTNKWQLLVIAIVALYIIIDLLSDRDPFRVMFSYLLFNAHNGYVRYYMWVNSIFLANQTIISSMFGYGFSTDMFQLIDSFFFANLMSESIDSFWLVNLLRYGWPMFMLLTIFVILIFRQSIKSTQKQKKARNRQLLTAWFIAAVSLTLISLTVHLWGSSSSFFMFVMACAATSFRAKSSRRPNSKLESKLSKEAQE